MYWAEALASQDKDADLKSTFSPIAAKMIESETAIVNELNAVQGSAIDVKGYYDVDDALTAKAMRPSTTLNAIIDSI